MGPATRSVYRKRAEGAGVAWGRAPVHARLLAIDHGRIVDVTLAPLLSVDPAPAVDAAQAAELARLAAAFPGQVVVAALPPGGDAVLVDVTPAPPAGVVGEVSATAEGRLELLRLPAGAQACAEPGARVARGELLARIAAPSLEAFAGALAAVAVAGVDSDLERLRLLAAHPAVAEGTASPAMRGIALPEPDLLVLRGGLQTTVQAWPGRLGLWEVGVPPSGPMDDLALRLANRAVGNPPEAAGLEICMQGPVLRAGRDLLIALGGASFAASIARQAVPWWTPVALPAGQELRIDGLAGAGCRCYLAVRGGLAAAPVLGSAATFTLGGFGGHRGRVLATGDRLGAGPEPAAVAAPIPPQERPAIARSWRIGVLEGPHADGEFLLPEGRAALLAAEWTVSPQSSRTGVRLQGPKPRWARHDGGEAGLHPSNIHDTAYAFAAVDLTGDTPIVLGPDGPSTGGFVCPAVVARGERWKLGQLRAGDRVRLVPVLPAEAARLRAEPGEPQAATARHDGVLQRLAPAGGHPGLTLRRAGDDFLLLEYGPMVLDLDLRLRVHALHRAVRDRAVPGIIDLVPAVRSLQVHYDPARLGEEACADLLLAADRGLPAALDAVPSRTVHLPLSWDDPSTRTAIEIYMRTVNPAAPWCPWNIEFIRRINGLESVEEVRRIVFAAEYLVLGLGDVYLGAPVAVPVDPRHRLVTTKYNPARTWTPENAVGIGGAYLCVYGMEGPGGYQFIGRTVQMWSTWRQAGGFDPGTPWLLRPFDRIRFYPVDAGELERLRADAPRCGGAVRIEDGVFDLAALRATCVREAADIAAFTARRDAAFAAERARWSEAAP